MFLDLKALLNPLSFQAELAQLESMCQAGSCTDLIIDGQGDVSQFEGESEPDSCSYPFAVSPELKSAVEAAVEQVLVGAVVHWDLVWFRAKGRNAGTPRHCDRTYLEKNTSVFASGKRVATLWCLMRDLEAKQSQLVKYKKSAAIKSAAIKSAAREAGDAVLFCADQEHGATVGRSGKLRFSFDVRVTFDELKC
jgi:hypothetical protein